MSQVLILGTRPINEFDKVVTVYTREWGKFEAIARGSLKDTSKQGPHLDSFNTIDCEFIQGKYFPIITGAHSIICRDGIKKSLIKMAAASFFAQAMDIMAPEREPDDVLYDFLENVLSEVETSNNTLKVFRAGQRDLLMAMGYLSDKLNCSLCSLKMNVSGAFDHRFGGLVCRDCFSGYGQGILLSESDISAIAGKDSNSLQRTILDSLFEYNAGESLKSLDFFYRIINSSYSADRNVIQ